MSSQEKKRLQTHKEQVLNAKKCILHIHHQEGEESEEDEKEEHLPLAELFPQTFSQDEYRKFQPSDEYQMILFSSKSKPPFHQFSNFHYIPGGMDMDGIVYPSTEHAFQAQKFIVRDRVRFSITGDLGSIQKGFSFDVCD